MFALRTLPLSRANAFLAFWSLAKFLQAASLDSSACGETEDNEDAVCPSLWKDRDFGHKSVDGMFYILLCLKTSCAPLCSAAQGHPALGGMLTQEK